MSRIDGTVDAGHGLRRIAANTGELAERVKRSRDSARRAEELSSVLSTAASGALDGGAARGRLADAARAAVDVTLRRAVHVERKSDAAADAFQELIDVIEQLKPRIERSIEDHAAAFSREQHGTDELDRPEFVARIGHREGADPEQEERRRRLERQIQDASAAQAEALKINGKLIEEYQQALKRVIPNARQFWFIDHGATSGTPELVLSGVVAVGGAIAVGGVRPWPRPRPRPGHAVPVPRPGQRAPGVVLLPRPRPSENGTRPGVPTFVPRPVTQPRTPNPSTPTPWKPVVRLPQGRGTVLP